MMDSTATSNCDPPNFRTVLPLPFLLEGFRKTLAALYVPSAFYNRGYRSLAHWKARKPQKPPEIPFLAMLGIMIRSIVHQGILSSYRKAILEVPGPTRCPLVAQSTKIQPRVCDSPFWTPLYTLRAHFGG